jgi:hypothetical protein
MKRLLISVALCTFATVSFAECSSAVSSADDAYRHARRAYQESNFEDAKNYMRRSRNAADEGRSYAENCSCPEAASFLEDAYSYARRGYNESNLQELQYYSRKAMSSAEDGQNAANSCK